jgi:hypothetical protein
LDIELEAVLRAGADVVLSVQDIPVTYGAGTRKPACEGRGATSRRVNEWIRLRASMDRASNERFGSDGEVAIRIGVDATGPSGSARNPVEGYH